MTWNPFKDEGATRIEDAPEWDPFRDEGAKRLDADPMKVIDVDPSAFKGRESFSEPEKVSVADWLEKNHGVKFDDGVRDYEGKAKAFGLSGDAKGDFETLKHRESTLAARKKSSLGYVPGGTGVSGFIEAGLKSEARGAKRYVGNLARNTPAVISKALWDTGAGTVNLAAFVVDFAMMGDPRGKGPEVRRLTENPTAWMRGIADYTGKAYGVDEDFESGITGMLMQGAGTIAAGVSTRGASIYGQMFTEGLRDSEAELGKAFAEFTSEEKDEALFKSMVYSVVGGRFEKIGLGKIAPKWFKSGAVLPKSRVVRMLRAGAFESGTEGTQNVLLNVLGAAIEGDREILTGQRFKDLALDMALGFVLGSGANITMEAGGAAVERLDSKGEIGRTIDRQMPYREDGSFNPAYKPMPLFKADGSWNMPMVDAMRELEKARKEEEALSETEGEQAEAARDRVSKAEQVFEGLLDEADNRDMGEAAWNIRRYNAKLAAGINPMEGATETDWKFVNEYYSDEEVGAHVVQMTGDESLVPVALQAKHGDTEAQEQYVERTLVPADSEILVEAEVTPEEAEAMRAVEASQSEDFYRRLYPELFQTETPQSVQAEAMRDMIDFVSNRQLEGSTIEQVDEIRSFEQDLNDMRDQGVPEVEIERFAFNRVQAAGLDPMGPGNAPGNLAVYGRNEADFRRGVWRDVSKLFRGADPLTVVEETSEGFLKRMIAEGELTYQDVAAWRETMGDKGGESEAELIEWLSDQSKAWMVGKSSLLEREQQMPSAFRRFLAQMFENFRHLFRRAAQLKGMDRRGELDPEFKDFLERSNGLDEDFLRDRLERPAQMESVSDVEINLLEAVPLAGLPRPDMEPEYRGELEQIFEAFGKNWKSYPKKAITLDEVMLTLQGEGFDVQTPADVIDAYMAVSRGERVVNATNFTDSASYSMGRTTVTPNPDTQTFLTKDGGLIGPATYSLKAFHGTPHKVDKFKTDNIGTGEGAQAYGWGLYFAESEGVANSYRKGMSPEFKTPSGRVKFDEMDFSDEALAADYLNKHDGDFVASIAEHDAWADRPERPASLGRSDQRVGELLRKWQSERWEYVPPSSNLYRVELDVEDSDLLDWDAPLSEQPAKVREALGYPEGSIVQGLPVDPDGQLGEWEYGEVPTGASMYGQFVIDGGDSKTASETLASLGIKGIRYLDGASRGQGEGSYNYVIFNDADITIAEENGEPVSLATYSLGRISDLGGDPEQMQTARERTPEERVLAQKLREFRTDKWLTQAQQNRINKTPADGRAKLLDEFRKDFQRELQVLQTKATESRKRQRLQQSGERKIAAVEARRLEQIKALHDQGEDVTLKLEQLDRIKKGLPTAVRHRLGGEVQVSRRKTRMGRQNEVNRRLVRARELAEGHEATRRKAWLRRTLKRYGTQSGPKLQNLSKEVTKDVRDRLRVALYAAHQDRPEETLERMAKPEGMDQQIFEDTARDFVGLLQPNNRDYARIEAAYFAVQDLIREGKYSMDQFRDQRKARLDELALTSTKQALQGNTLLNDSEIAQQEEASGVKGKAGRWLSNSMSGYTDGFENIIRRIDGEQEGPIWRELYADPVDGIAASQDRVNIYVADVADMLLDGMATAFPDLTTKRGEPDVSAISKRLTEWERHPGKGERTGIEMSDREGGEVVDRPLSIAEAITVKLLLRQEGSHPTFRIQHGVEDIAAFEKAVDAYIGPDALAFVEHVISPFYDGAFNQLNEVYMRVEGHEMDPVKDYFPFLREIASENVEDAGNPFTPFDANAAPDGVEKGSLKTRSEMVTLPFRFQSVTSVLQNSIRTNANYIGKAGLEKKFRRLTTDPNFKRALKQRFGAKAIKQFVNAANVFTAGRMQQSGWGGWLDAARSRMITGVLAAKPKIMFTQLTSIPAGAVDMPVTEWVSGVAQIMRSPEKHFRELLTTPQMRHRISQAQAQETITSLNKLQSLGLGAGWGAQMELAIKYSMILIKVGDVAGASLSAGPIYFRAKARELKAGKSEAQAKQIASHEFAMAVNRSQQSPHLHSRPQSYQQSEFLRALYAFRSAPIQYQSEVNRAISEFVRISLDSNQSKAKRWEVAKQSGKAFFVYHILLPQLFYALNNALTGFWLDDDDRVLDYWKGAGLTMLLGNFAAIPVAGDTVYASIAKASDTSYFSPNVAPLGAQEIARLPDYLDHLFSGTSEQRVKAASRLGNFTGLPVETITKQAQSFGELLEDDDPTKFLELMGWSPFIFGNQ